MAIAAAKAKFINNPIGLAFELGKLSAWSRGRAYTGWLGGKRFSLPAPSNWQRLFTGANLQRSISAPKSDVRIVEDFQASIIPENPTMREQRLFGDRRIEAISLGKTDPLLNDRGYRNYLSNALEIGVQTTGF